MNKTEGILGDSLSIKEQLNQVEEFFKMNNSEASAKSIDDKKQIEVAFAIPLKSKKHSRDWDTVQANLSKTLRSILNNTDQNFRIIIAGHEKPEIEELRHERVTWLAAKFSPPKDARGYGKDRERKRRKIGVYLKKKGFSGYYMPLDADDWVHYRFVEFIRSRPVTDAFIINKGFMVNLVRQETWQYKERFYRGCGSSAVFYFNNNQLPKTEKDFENSKLFNSVVKAHSTVVTNMEKYKKNYILVDIPFVTWVLGHGDNWSVMSGAKDDGISAKDYKVIGENLEEWFYDYFKINIIK